MFNAFIESKLNEPRQNQNNRNIRGYFDKTAKNDSAFENKQDCAQKFCENLDALLNPLCE